jgi:hypothetical protein
MQSPKEPFEMKKLIFVASLIATSASAKPLSTEQEVTYIQGAISGILKGSGITLVDDSVNLRKSALSIIPSGYDASLYYVTFKVLMKDGSSRSGNLHLRTYEGCENQTTNNTTRKSWKGNQEICATLYRSEWSHDIDKGDLDIASLF